MTQLAYHPGYLELVNHLDAIGQKHRVQLVLRGVIHWLAVGIVVTAGAAFAANAAGAGEVTRAITVIWAAWLIGSFIFFFLRPLLLRPDPVDVARLIESKIDGLHNGLTNSVLLAAAPDLADSPWLPAIIDEIASTARTKSLDQAVRLSDLYRLMFRALIIVVPTAILVVVLHTQFAHGWQQMFRPGRFVPKAGAMQQLDVQPGDVTVVAGQPLEITIVATGPSTQVAQQPQAALVFDSSIPEARLNPTAAADTTTLQYAYRLDHVDHTLKYRVEDAGTQSPWYTATVVPKVSLRELELTITPPSYTHQPAKVMSIAPDAIDKTPVSVPQGSSVQVAAMVDVPAKRAVLQVNADAPLDMTAAMENRRFVRSVPVASEVTIFVEPLQGEQILAKLPENGLVIHVTADAPPTVTMKSPAQGVTLPPAPSLTISAELKDDWGVASARLLMADGDSPLAAVADSEKTFANSPLSQPFTFPIQLKPEESKHGSQIRIQVEVTDNRDLVSLLGKDGGPQTSRGPEITIKFRDPQQIAAEERAIADKLRERLMEMLKKQQGLHDSAIAFKAGDQQAITALNAGQSDLRSLMQSTADSFEFDAKTQIIKRTLQMLAVNAAKEAVDLSSAAMGELVQKEQLKLVASLRVKQQNIISTLESLLALLDRANEPATQPSNKDGGDLASKPDPYKALDEALKEFMKREQRILDQTAGLAKKPVDNFDDADKKKLDDLAMAQEKLDAFMQEKLADFSKNAEQDLSNPSMLKDLMQIYSEVTMAKDALNQKAAEIAVPLEESGLELAKEEQSNLEKWLADKPDRQKWTMEDPVSKTDTPMPELPKELEDMVGQLMEQEEDLFDQMEDANANWQDSIDKGVGWDAMDGPIADMSAKGVTGNALPNNNEMQGRSGEGRTGKSQGEFVGDTAVGKGGRRTPTRLDPTPFEKGQIHDESKDPTGGATGGGKVSGQGGQGLEGPVPPQQKQEMQRLADKQAQIRNSAERLNLQYQLGRYDNFKLLNGIALMRRVESDLQANRYQNALRRRDVLIDSLETSQTLLGGQVHVEQDTTPTANLKTRQDIHDAMQGELPPAWSDALKEYYRKLSQE